MPITLATPVTVPQKQADGVWVIGLNIAAPAADRAVLAGITVAPYNTTTGEIIREKAKTISIRDVYTEAATKPALAAAIQAIYTAVDEQISTKNITF